MSQSRDVSIRQAKLAPRKTGRPILQEVYTFAKRAHLAELDAPILTDVDPLSLFSLERLSQCDEAFVAEQNGRIVGAVTLSFNGVFAPRVPTLDGLYVLGELRGRGIGSVLLETSIRRFVELGKTPVLCKVSSYEMNALLDSLGNRLPELREKINVLMDCS